MLQNFGQTSENQEYSVLDHIVFSKKLILNTD